MSSAGGQEQQAGITLEEALRQLELLEAQIKQLQAAASDVEARIAQLTAVEDALSDIRSGSDDVLFPLDPAATVVVRGAVRPLDTVIVHVGLNIFVEMKYDKAVEFVREEKAGLSKLLDAYSREIARLTQYYNALRSAIEQAIAGAAARQQQ